MCKQINYSEKKYNIIQELHKMNIERYRHIMANLPNALHISEPLWRKWLYLGKYEAYEIPYSQFVQLAQLLNLDPKKLINYPIKEHEPLIIKEKVIDSQMSIYQMPGV